MDRVLIEYTGLAKVIGSPVEYTDDKAHESSVEPIIPATAQRVRPPEKVACLQPETIMGPAKPLAPPRSFGKGPKPLRTLGLYTSDWTVKVRLTKKGEPKQFMRQQKGGEGWLLPLEIVDEEGTQMTATLFNEGIKKYQSLLQENKCYLISHGNVKIAAPSLLFFFGPALCRYSASG